LVGLGRSTRPGRPTVDVGDNRLTRHGACVRALCVAVLATRSTTWTAQRWRRNKHTGRHSNDTRALLSDSSHTERESSTSNTLSKSPCTLLTLVWDVDS